VMKYPIDFQVLNLMPGSAWALGSDIT